jgi:hypothetical protein
MGVAEFSEIWAWGLIVAAFVFAALARRGGLQVAAIAAVLAALITKAALLDHLAG